MLLQKELKCFFLIPAQWISERITRYPSSFMFITIIHITCFMAVKTKGFEDMKRVAIV